MKNFNQLIIAEVNEISESEKMFLETHHEIMRSGSIISEFAVNLSINLKKMRDEKLYIEAGFESFADYTEKAIGLKERQAYNYIRIAENFDEEFLHLNAKIGITKLMLLSNLTSEELEKVEASVDISDTTVNELKEQIKLLEEQGSEHDKAYDKALVEITSKQEKIKKLEKEIKDLKAKPVEKEVVKVKDEKAAAELSEVKKNYNENLNLLITKEAELEKLKKQLEIAADQNMIKFKIKFEDFQKAANELLSTLGAINEDKKEKCKAAIKDIIEKSFKEILHLNAKSGV